MQIQINRQPYKLIDGTADRSAENRVVELPPGVYDVARVPNPFGHAAGWLVLVGTLTGAAELSLRQWVEGMEPDPRWKDRTGEDVPLAHPWVIVYDDAGNILPAA